MQQARAAILLWWLHLSLSPALGEESPPLTITESGFTLQFLGHRSSPPLKYVFYFSAILNVRRGSQVSWPLLRS